MENDREEDSEGFEEKHPHKAAALQEKLPRIGQVLSKHFRKINAVTNAYKSQLNDLGQLVATMTEPMRKLQGIGQLMMTDWPAVSEEWGLQTPRQSAEETWAFCCELVEKHGRTRALPVLEKHEQFYTRQVKEANDELEHLEDKDDSASEKLKSRLIAHRIDFQFKLRTFRRFMRRFAMTLTVPRLSEEDEDELLPPTETQLEQAATALSLLKGRGKGAFDSYAALGRGLELSGRLERNGELENWTTGKAVCKGAKRAMKRLGFAVDDAQACWDALEEAGEAGYLPAEPSDMSGQI